MFSGMDGPHSLPFPTISFLHSVNIQVLKDIIVFPEPSPHLSHWLDAQSLNIQVHLSPEWSEYIHNLQLSGSHFLTRRALSIGRVAFIDQQSDLAGTPKTQMLLMAGGT